RAHGGHRRSPRDLSLARARRAADRELRPRARADLAAAPQSVLLRQAPRRAGATDDGRTASDGVAPRPVRLRPAAHGDATADPVPPSRAGSTSFVVLRRRRGPIGARPNPGGGP